MPPRHGKSELASHWWPVWCLERDPTTTFIVTSYGARLAQRWSRRVRNTIRENPRALTVRLASDSAAQDVWETTAGGGMIAAGVEGAITGMGGDVLLIDDPVKDREQAESAIYRQAAWEWYTDTAYTRLSPTGSVVLVMTRWHVDDLGGRLEAEERAGGDKWRVVSFPAIAEGPDELGRAEGDALWPERWPADRLELIRRVQGPYGWASLYQQSPVPKEGGAFWTAELLRLARETAPRNMAGELAPDFERVVVGVDPSTTSNRDSAECGIIVAGRERVTKRAGVLEDLSGRMSPEAWAWRAIAAYQHHQADRIVYEANQGGDLVPTTIRLVAQARGVPVPPMKAVHASRGKAARAEPVAALYETGQVWHASVFSKLDTQLLTWVPSAKESPDRLDAAVWALWELMIEGRRATLQTF